jgi:hypothetical protein
MNKQQVDIDAIERELDAQFTEAPASEEPVEATEEVSETQEQEPEVQSDPEENVETVEEAPTEEPEPAPTVNDPDEHKRNAAFKQLREERDKLAESDKFLTDLATQYGLSKEELIQRYKDEADKKNAEKEGLTPEQYKKIQDLESRLSKTEQARREEVFNYEAERVAQKYNISDSDLMKVFEFAKSNKIEILQNPSLLEFAYRSYNYDNAVEQGRQQQLKTSKQRRSRSVGQTGTQKMAPPVDERQAMEAEIDAYLKEKNIIK